MKQNNLSNIKNIHQISPKNIFKENFRHLNTNISQLDKYLLFKINLGDS